MKKKRSALEHHFSNSGSLIRPFIFGAEDGLISTLGMLSGVSGANLNGLTIIIAGIVSVFAAAISMGIGTYLSSKSQIELYKREIQREKEEIETVPN